VSRLPRVVKPGGLVGIRRYAARMTELSVDVDVLESVVADTRAAAPALSWPSSLSAT
jgi:hypothetical protein